MRITGSFGLWCSAVALAAAMTAACGGNSREDHGAASPRAGSGSAPAQGGQDREAVVERLRAELARLLKKDASQLPIDTPVTQLGADDLTVVEWQMAAERTFRVDIDDDVLFDPGTKTKKDLTVASMADIVARASR
jgi:acyl carrier protein